MCRLVTRTENSRLNSPLYPSSARRASSGSLISTTIAIASTFTFSAEAVSVLRRLREGVLLTSMVEQTDFTSNVR